MNAPKPAKSLAGQKCPICETGSFQLVQIGHTENVAEDNQISIPDIWVDRCDNCGEVLFPGETTHFIENVVAEKSETLTPSELEGVREDLGVERQDEMSEILGLGNKSYHKWESGAQFPTRSMCYYIRVLAEFPQAFEWLRRRAWRDRNRVRAPQAETDWKAMFPDLATVRNTEFYRVCSTPKKINPALGLTRVAFLK